MNLRKLKAGLIGLLALASVQGENRLTFPKGDLAGIKEVETVGDVRLFTEKYVGAGLRHQLTFHKILENACNSFETKRKYPIKDSTNILERMHNSLKKDGVYFNYDNFFWKGFEAKDNPTNVYGFDCDKFATLYLSIGKKKGLPLEPVVMSHHVFVRWRDGTNYINWETTYGWSPPDTYYLDLAEKYDWDNNRGANLSSLLNAAAKEALKRRVTEIEFINSFPEMDIEDSGSPGVRKQYQGLSEYLTNELRKNPRDLDVHRKRLYACMRSYQWEKAISDANQIYWINRDKEEYERNVGEIEGFMAELKFEM